MSDTAELQTPHQLRFKYRYERILGEGTNGKTFLATDLFTGKYVAIKALKLVQSENFKSFELFKREAETLSSIQVPGVPQFYQSILSDKLGEACYIVQEYIDAPSIQNYLNDGRIFSERETLTIMQKVAAILHVLHSQYSPPIIHRDIKPSNLLCRLPESSDKEAWEALKIYLIDFGAVANAHSNSDKSTIAGTIGYMAPEQNFGESQPQTDLYALGATALHMLTGVPPYEMDFDTYSLKYEEALDLNAPKTSAGMRDLLGRLLNYSIDKRPATSAELMRMIANVREGRMCDAVAPKPPEPSTRETVRQIWREACDAHTAFTIVRFLQKLRQHYRDVSRENSIGDLPKRYLDMLHKPDKYSDKLKAVWGTAYNYSTAELSPGEISTMIEYTFNANGVTWGGMSVLPLEYASDNTLGAKELADARKLDSIPIELLLRINRYALSIYNDSGITFPLPCIILYHPDDPSCNKLSCLDVGKIIPDIPFTKSVQQEPTDVHWDTLTTNAPFGMDYKYSINGTNIELKPFATEEDSENIIQYTK
ncbi:MAG: serine/threonine protein kinase [Proteobacteria bacterium]|nr:serine/threonine protein kinase [Pseudomonadota bacterium]